MQDKSKLGTRYVCFQCGCKFYDMNREIPTCPECGEDQTGAPLRDIRSLLGSRGRRKAPTVPKTAPKAAPEEEVEEDEDDATEEQSD